MDDGDLGGTRRPVGERGQSAAPVQGPVGSEGFACEDSFLTQLRPGGGGETPGGGGVTGSGWRTGVGLGSEKRRMIG